MFVQEGKHQSRISVKNTTAKETRIRDIIR